MMKKIVAFLLATAISLTLIIPAAATNNVNQSMDTSNTMAAEQLLATIDEGNIEHLTISQLQDAAKYAKDDRMATAIFEELVDRAVTSGMSYAAATNYIVDGYVEITNYYQNSNTLTITYKVKAKIPSAAAVFVGYDYPAATRANGGSTSISSKNTGTYSETYSGVSELIAKQVCTSMTARNYSERHPYGTIYGSTAISTDYHEVSALEVTAGFVLYTIVPGIAVEILPQTKIIKYIGQAINIGATVYSYLDSLNVNLGVPAPVVGHYYVTETWYSNNKLNSRVRVWLSKARYNAGEREIFDSGNYVVTTLPDF